LKNRGTINKQEAEKIVEESEKHQPEPAKLDSTVHNLAYVKDE
jgi:hypothetical protein